MSERYATVDSRRDVLVVASYSKTTAGFWVMNGQFEVIDAEAGDARLVRAIRNALANSREGVAVPDWSTSPIAPVLTELGVKTFAAYLKGAKQVGVRSNGQVILTPTRNLGARDGFVELDDRSVAIDRVGNASELAAAVHECLAAAE